MPVLSAAGRDRALAAVLLLIGGVEVATFAVPGTSPALLIALLAAMCLPLAWRRRRPIATAVWLFAVGLTMLHVTPEEAERLSVPFLGVLLVSYTIGAELATRAALAGLATCVAGAVAMSTSLATATVGDYVFPAGFCLVAWTAGRVVRHRLQLTAELHEAAARAREAREAEAARAVADERRRIAREMHDVVAHSVSVMVVQAGGARRIIDRDPERAAEAARLIERTGRTALVEMRRLLGVLHYGEQEPELAPQPTLAEVDGLVERARSAGLPVSLRVEGERRPLPTGAEAAAYRVVQEALTNALKHADAPPTAVVLRWDGDGLEVVVADSGSVAGAHTVPLPSGGHGIAGMRERVRVYGGTLEAAPRPGGGWLVRARIPLHQDSVEAGLGIRSRTEVPA